MLLPSIPQNHKTQQQKNNNNNNKNNNNQNKNNNKNRKHNFLSYSRRYNATEAPQFKKTTFHNKTPTD